MDLSSVKARLRCGFGGSANDLGDFANPLFRPPCNPLTDPERPCMTDLPAAPAPLPATGHTYRVDFGGDYRFDIDFGPNYQMTFTRLAEPNAGAQQTVHYTYRALREGLYMVYWQEQDKTTVVHVEDFVNHIVYSNITRPDGTFYNGISKLEQIK